MTKIQIRRDQSNTWSSVNPLLADGEMGVELDTLKIKIGDGSRNWDALPYVAGEGAVGLVPGDDVSELVNDAGYLTEAEVNQILANGGYITEVEALDDIGDVSVAGATEDQYLRYNGTNWVAETVTGIADSLQFQGTVDCTTDEAPGAPLAGWFYFNTGTGAVLSSWVGITTDVTNGDRVVYGADNQWHIVGNVNDGGNVTLDSLSVVVEDPAGDSDLAYNNSTGVFTYTPPDLVTSNIRLASNVRTSFLQLASRVDVDPPASLETQEDGNVLDVAILSNHETRIPKSMTEAEANDLDVYHNVDTDQITVKGVIPSDMRRMDALPTP